MPIEKRWPTRFGTTSERVTQIVTDTGGTARRLTGRATGPSIGSLGRGASALSQTLQAVPAPSSTLEAPWHVGLAQILTGGSSAPAGVSRLLAQLDRFGSISVSRDNLGFDGEEAAWEATRAVTLAPVHTLIAGAAVQREVERLASAMPPLPGRTWAVLQVAETLLGLAAAAARIDERGGAAFTTLVPCEVTSKGRLRSTTLRPGLFAVLVMATRPEVADVIVTTAEARGIAVTTALPSRASERGASMATFAVTLRERLRGVTAEPTDDGSASSEPNADPAR